MFLQKAELVLRSDRSPKRLPDFFALGVESGIVAPGIDMADEILMAGGFPTFSAVFGRFHA